MSDIEEMLEEIIGTLTTDQIRSQYDPKDYRSVLTMFVVELTQADKHAVPLLSRDMGIAQWAWKFMKLHPEWVMAFLKMSEEQEPPDIAQQEQFAAFAQHFVEHYPIVREEEAS